MEKQSFTQEEVMNILVSMFIFAGANNNQDLSPIKGQTYGQQAETIIKAHENYPNSEMKNSIIGAIQQFR